MITEYMAYGKNNKSILLLDRTTDANQFMVSKKKNTSPFCIEKGIEVIKKTLLIYAIPLRTSLI